jgi:hypothetical protein
VKTADWQPLKSRPDLKLAVQLTDPREARHYYHDWFVGKVYYQDMHGSWFVTDVGAPV